MRLAKIIVSFVMGVALLLGTTHTGLIMAQGPSDNASEADESAALQQQAAITPDQAKATAEAANPGATVTTVELGDENGVVAYSVLLTNGQDVKVDASNGSILSTDQASQENEPGGTEGDAASDKDNVQDQGGADTAGASDKDNVQEQSGSQAND